MLPAAVPLVWFALRPAPALANSNAYCSISVSPTVVYPGQTIKITGTVVGSITGNPVGGVTIGPAMLDTLPMIDRDNPPSALSGDPYLPQRESIPALPGYDAAITAVTPDAPISPPAGQPYDLQASNPDQWNFFAGSGGYAFGSTFTVTAEIYAVPNGFQATIPNGGHGASMDDTGVVADRCYAPYTIKPYLTPKGGQITPSEQPGCTNAAEPQVKACTTKADPVNTATGQISSPFTDLQVPGRGLPLDLTRTYNSTFASRTGPFGYGWTCSYCMSLKIGATSITVRQEDGSEIDFFGTGPTYTAAPRVQATLTQQGNGSYVLKRRNRDRFYFSSAGVLQKEVDLNGYQTTLAYDSHGHLALVTDPAGRQLKFTWSGGYITGVTDPAGRSVSFAYDGAGNLSQVTDVAGGHTSFTYDSSHRLLTTTDPTNATTTQTYDSQGRVTSQKDPLNRTTSFQYDTPAAGQTTVYDPAGRETLDTYQNGELVQESRGQAGAPTSTWTFAYDPKTAGVIAATDPDNHTTKTTYDSNGNPLTVIDGLGRKTTNTYDSLNDLTSTTDPTGETTTYTYDALGNLLSKSKPLQGTADVQTTTYHYGDGTHPGDVTAIGDPLGNTSHYAYDAHGDLISFTDPAGDQTTYGYDHIGRQSSMVAPRGNVAGGNPPNFTTTYAYDAFGDLTQSTDPLGHTLTGTYDADRRLVSETDADGNTTAYTHDLAGELTQITRPGGSTVKFVYRPDGTVSSRRDQNDHLTTYTYDALARPTQIADPLGRLTQYAYDQAGNLTSMTTPDSLTTTYAYDAANQLTTIAYSDGTTPNVSFAYDKAGRRIKMTDGTGTTSYQYDSLGRLTKETNGAGAQVRYQYDLADRPTRIIYPSGDQVARKYDAAGRLVKVTDPLANQTAFSFDANSNLKSETLPAASAITDTFTYDRADRLTQISDKKVTSTFASFAYARDPTGLLTSETSTGVPGAGTTSYAYDQLHRLTSAGASAYGYDAADNPTSLPGGKSLTFDTADQLTQLADGTGTTSFTYNQRGDRTAMTPPSGPAAAYVYDQADRLTSLVKGAHSATYSYNGDGLRMSKTVDGGAAEDFAWDTQGSLPLVLQDGTREFVYGPGTLPLEQIDGSTARWLHQDQLGSTRLLTNASGAVVGAFSYSPYGKLSGQSGTATTPLGYAGQYTDPESGLQYLRARYYDPQTSQFLSRDPQAAQTFEPYAYAADDPTNAADPSGLRPSVYVGDLIYTHGKTEVRRWNNTTWLPAYPNMRIYLGDTVRTSQETGIAGIEFANGMQVGIAEDSQVYVNTEGSVESIPTRTTWQTFKLCMGELWCRVTHQYPDESFTVETRGGVLGIRDAGYQEIPGESKGTF